MKRIYIILLLFCFSFIACSGGSEESHKKSGDIFAAILNETNSEIVEYGLKTVFKAENNGEKECADIINKLDIGEEKQFSVYRDEKSYSINFTSKDISGYIESINVENTNRITVEIVEHKSIYDMEALQQQLNRALGCKKEELEFFQYVKSRIRETDVKAANDFIIKLLKKEGATNIVTTDLGSSVSTIADTGKYKKIKNGKSYMDFNSAVCSYESGNYLIIGTPIIMTTY